MGKVEQKNLMIERLRAGEFLLGLTNMYPASGIIEGMAKEWDFVWIDAQHGEMSYDSVLCAVQAAMAVGVDTLVRVPGLTTEYLGKFADLAPSAIMVPMISNAEQARAAVEGLCFPPLGDRSYGGRRVIDLYGRDYYRDREMLVVAQIETLDGAENADEIIGTEGIDCLFFGPDDMRVRMDVSVGGSILDDGPARDAMARTAQAARVAGKYACCPAPTPELLTAAIDMGYHMAVGGSDVAFLRFTSADKLALLREVLGSHGAGDGASPDGSVY